MATSLFKKVFTSIENNKLSDAVLNIDELIKQNPANPSNYIKKGDICLKLNREKQALVSYLNAALLFKRQGFHRKTISVCKLIFRLDPDNEVAQKTAMEAMNEMQAIEGKSAGLPGAEPGDSNEKDIPLRKKEQKVVQEETAVEEDIPLRKKEQKVVQEETAVNQQEIMRNSFFSVFKSDELWTIFKKARLRNYSKGETVIKEGEPGDTFYAIKEGTARVVSNLLGRDIELALLNPGDMFGEAAFMTGRERTASVVSNESLAVYEFDRDLMLEMLKKSPEIMENLDEIYHQRAKVQKDRLSEK